MSVAPKSKKSKTVASPPAHPTYEVMIKTAIATVKDRGGTSRQAILKYLKQNYKVGTNVDTQVRLQLPKLVTKGVLERKKGQGASGSFKVAAQKSEPKKKKTAVQKKATKKPAAKKAVAKKPAEKKKTTAVSKSKKVAAKKSSPKKTTAKKAATKKAAGSKTAKKSPSKAKKATVKKSAKKPAAKKAAKKKWAASYARRSNKRLFSEPPTLLNQRDRLLFVHFFLAATNFGSMMSQFRHWIAW